MAAARTFARTVGRVAAHTPGLKRLPVMRLVAVAEVAMLARDHVQRLTPEERRRAIELVREARGRRRNMSEAEREELAVLVAKMDARGLAGQAVDAISPVPLPGRVKNGPRHRT